jgi:hypothetical protein
MQFIVVSHSEQLCYMNLVCRSRFQMLNRPIWCMFTNFAMEIYCCCRWIPTAFSKPKNSGLTSVFSYVFERVRGSGSFPSVSISFEHPVQQDVTEQENITKMVQWSPGFGTHRISTRLCAAQTRVCRMLHEKGMYPATAVQRVQQVESNGWDL